MKHLKHPATVIAAIALFAALGGGAWASALISGARIKNHSIPAKKLTKSAIKSLRGQRGATSPAGPAGPKGDTGATGPQGPGGKIVTYDATASTTPATKTLGTFLGDTIGVQCTTSPGSAQLTVLLKTSDGSWDADYSYVNGSNGSSLSTASNFRLPAGTLTTFTPEDAVSVNSSGIESDSQVDFVQIGPSPGSMVWHEEVSTKRTNATCHLSVQTFPEAVTRVTP